jgi:integrase
VLTAAVTAFIRFLVAQGLQHPGLLGAVPRLRRWKMSSLPRYVSEEEIARLLEVCRDGSAMGLRDEALLVVLFRLGLRAGEAARLSLDDVSWRDGLVLVRATKTRRERTLPLPEDVGPIVGRYLREGRPPTTYRGIFVRHLASIVPLTSGGVAAVARKTRGASGIQGFQAGNPFAPPQRGHPHGAARG